MAHLAEVMFVLFLTLAVTAFSAPCCPDGWVKLQGRCYKYQATRQDWASAEKSCLGLGGHLVSIHNEIEYQLVKSVIKAHDHQENAAWIGLYSTKKHPSWFWSDGTKVTFTKWNPGEPNSPATEFCTLMNWPKNGVGIKNWNDIACDNTFYSVCVRSPE